MTDWRTVPAAELPAHPKCKAPKPSEGTAYCGDTCTCGYREVKRRLALETTLGQIAAYERRWGPLNRLTPALLERVREAYEVTGLHVLRDILEAHDG